MAVVPFDILDWLTFPWCCENVQYDKEMTDLKGFYDLDENTDNPDGDEIAFYCTAHSHRILTSECPGMDCPNCKLRHHDVFIKSLEKHAGASE